MRAIITTLSSLTLVALISCASTPRVFAQDQPKADLSRDTRREWYSLAQGRTEFEVSDPALMPSLLGLAAEQSGCRYKEGLTVAPVRFLSVASRRLAIVTCWGSLKSHQRVFDLSNLQKPMEVQFPFAVPPKGFSTSADAPGFITWERETGLFRAETTSDVAYSPRVRYTYRLDGGLDGFVVLRVEVQRDGVGEWATIWDAPRWSLPANSTDAANQNLRR
jgi:hypothetical protein